MATIGVLTYNSPSTMPLNAGLKTANRNLNINNNNSNSNNNNIAMKGNNNNNNLKTKSKPTAKREMVIIRKKQKILPLTETNTNIINRNVMTTTTATIATTPTAVITASKALKRLLPDLNGASAPIGGKTKGSPLPVAVARRNARERNRVKQVNNGFAALRERIPEEVAEAFEAQGNGRGSAKKLSKVETLRMAVEYIRSLERVLELDSSVGNGLGLTLSDSHPLNGSYQPSDTSSVLSTLTPPPSDNISSGSFDDVDLLPDVTTLDGHQYIRIPGTNTYQLLSIGDDACTLYENEENMEPLLGGGHGLNGGAMTLVQPTDTEYLGPMVDPNSIGYGGSMQHAISTPIHILTPASISPGAYSGQSSVAGLSPAAPRNVCNNSVSVQLDKADQQHFVAAGNRGDGDSNSALYLGQLPGNLQPMMGHQFDGILTLKTEIKDEIYLDQQPLSDENMIEVMDWWNSQQAANNISSET